MTRGIDDRSAMAKAMSKASELTAISLMMIVPALIGIWIDRQLSTVLVFTLLGLFLGMFGAGYQLMRLVSVPKRNDTSATDKNQNDSESSESAESAESADSGN